MSRLGDLGYLDRPGDWTYPDDRDFNIAFEKLRKRMGGKLTFRPVDVPIEELVATASRERDGSAAL